MRGLFEGWHIVILLVLVVLLFGFKRLPDAARSVGRSMRIFKSEMSEMKNDDGPSRSAASSDTVRGETVRGEAVRGETVKGDTMAGGPVAGSAVRENTPETDNHPGPVA